MNQQSDPETGKPEKPAGLPLVRWHLRQLSYGLVTVVVLLVVGVMGMLLYQEMQEYWVEQRAADEQVIDEQMRAEVAEKLKQARECAAQGKTAEGYALLEEVDQLSLPKLETKLIRRELDHQAGKVPAGRLWTNSLGMKMAWVPAGSFQKPTDPGEPAVTVAVDKDFYISVHEITRAQWRAVMGTEPWSPMPNVGHGDDLPAVGMSWDRAKAFVDALNQREAGSGRVYSLPSVAQ